MKYKAIRRGMGSRAMPGDEYQISGDTWQNGSAFIGETIDIYAVDWRRPIKGHNWISFKDRKPTKEDAYFSPNRGYKPSGANISGLILVLLNPENTMTHWTKFEPPIFVEDEPVRVKVDNHEVIPNKDGSLTIGCKKVASSDFETIIKQREEAMKS